MSRPRSLISWAGALAFFALAAPGWAAQEPLDLSDCYRLALKQSEQIAARRELIAETEGRFLQALSGVLPRVTFFSTDKRQEEIPGSVFTQRQVPERKFLFSQPLFAGFKEFAAMAAVKAQKRQRRRERERAEQLLLVDVADAFYLLLEQQEDLDALGASREALEGRAQELLERERVGRSRPSEGVSARAQLHRLEAQMELVRSRQRVARQLLEFLTGLERIEAVREGRPAVDPLGPEQGSLAQALERSDVQAAREEAEVYRQQVRVARAKFFPTAGLEGNYYVERGGAAKEVDWDASLKVEVPLFQGGQAAGGFKEALSQERQARLRLAEAKRRAIQEIRDAYVRAEAALVRRAALARALQATEESYRFQVEEYRLNLVSNLDVLQTLQELQEARRELIQAHYEARRLYWRLKAAVGAGSPTEGVE